MSFLEYSNHTAIDSEEESPLLSWDDNHATKTSTKNNSGKHQHLVTNSPLSTIFLILNVMIGAGFLVQPYVFKQAGVITATILYLYFGFVCFEGASLLIYLAKRAYIFDFSDLVYHALGMPGAICLDISIVSILGGSVLTYVLLLGSLTSTVLLQLSSSSNSSVWYANEAFCSSIWVWCIILPLCITARHLGHLAMVAYYSILVVFATFFMIIIVGPILYGSSSSSTESFVDDLKSITWVTSGTGSLAAMGSILFAMAYLPAVLPAYQSATKPTQQHFTSFLSVCTSLGVVFYYVLGLVGYLTFREDTQVDILENFSGSWSVLFQSAICLHLAFIIPGYFVLIRQSLSKLLRALYACGQPQDVLIGERFQYNHDTSASASANQQTAEEDANDVYSYYAMTCGLLLVIFCISLSIQLTVGSGGSTAVMLVINLVGGVAGSVEIFVIPGLCGITVLANPSAASGHNNSNSNNSSNNNSSNNDSSSGVRYGTYANTKREGGSGRRNGGERTGDDHSENDNENENDNMSQWEKKHEREVQKYHYYGSVVLTWTGVVVAVLVTIGTATST